jgi:hypothetical protein
VDRHGSHCRGDSALAGAASANYTLLFDAGGDLSRCAGLEIRSATAQGVNPRAVGYSIRGENAVGLSCTPLLELAIIARIETVRQMALHGRRRIRRGGATEVTSNHRRVLVGTSMIHRSTLSPCSFVYGTILAFFFHRARH